MRSRSWHFRKGVGALKTGQFRSPSQKVLRDLGDLPLHIISNARHAPYYEEPAEFGRILRSELAAIANQQTDERTAP